MNPRIHLTLSTLILLSLAPASAPAQTCTGSTPAYPVPQYHTLGGPSLWPIDPFSGELKLRPAGVAPGTVRGNLDALPKDRDSSSWNSTRPPNAMWGQELFHDVAVAGQYDENAGTADFLVAVYSLGLQVWDLGNPENPARIHNPDGHNGGWMAFAPSNNEEDFFVKEVDVLEVGNKLYIATAGKKEVGVSIWTMDTTGNHALVQVYQDSHHDTTDVSLVREGSNGPVYAFAASSTGVRVYNASNAVASGPCNDNSANSACNVYKGTASGTEKAAYVHAIFANGQSYITTGQGSVCFAATPFRIWEVTDPEEPATGTTLRATVHSSGWYYSPQFFKYGTRYYAAFIHRGGTNCAAGAGQMQVFDVTDCLDGNGCTSIGVKALEDLKDSSSSRHFLTASFGEGKPYLYYGMEPGTNNGSGHERLWELGQLSASHSYGTNAVPEVTDGGGTYVQACDGKVIDYFADYYDLNENGVQNHQPRRAVFTGPYLYRAALGILDIHVRGGVQQTNDPEIFPRLQGAGTIDPTSFWIDDAVMLEAEVFNCLASSTSWCWDAAGNNVDVDIFPVPANSDGCDATFDDVHELTFACGASRCADTSVTVGSWNMSCLDTELDPNEVSFNLKDPQIEVEEPLNFETSYPVCSTVPLDASVNGRGVAQWAWNADGEPIPGCSGTVPAGADLSGASFACDWDTSGLKFEEVFLDGFETGCGRWSDGCPAESMLLGFGSTKQMQARRGSLAVKGGGVVNAELEIKDDNGVVVDSDFQPVDFFSDGDPTFSGAPSETVNGSGAVLQAPATGATLWIWEVEDPDAGTAACSFNGNKLCVTEETTTHTLEYLWLTGGATYTYKVSISNCVSPSPASAMDTVTVGTAVLPEITSFRVALTSINLSGDTSKPCNKNPLAGVVTCSRNESIDFEVVVLEEGSFTFSFDWDRATSDANSTFDEQTADSVSTTTYIFSHTFDANTPSPNYPAVQALFGNTMVLEDSLEFY